MAKLTITFLPLLLAVICTLATLANAAPLESLTMAMEPYTWDNDTLGFLEDFPPPVDEEDYSLLSPQVKRHHPTDHPPGAGGLLMRFYVAIARFEGDRCNSSKIISPHKPGHERFTIVKEGHCKTWPDHRPFNSMTIVWNDHGTWLENRKMYGHCEVRLFEGEKCEGRSVGFIKDANLILTKGRSQPMWCPGPFMDEHMRKGSALSVKVTCIR